MPKIFLLSIYLISVVLAQPAALRVLIVTGGHDFEEEAFFNMFQNMKSITWKHERFGSGAESSLTVENASTYDVAVFYDMHQAREPHWQSWLQVLRRGKPSVFLHHSLGSYVDWTEYQDIVGGHANFSKRIVPGTPNATFQHDVSFHVRLADPDHPITAGLHDFDIVDETYDKFSVKPEVHSLLTTDQPGSGRIVGWTNAYGGSRVVYIQLGHDHTAYDNPNYRALVERSILWTAGRLK